jgi:CcmD family protein
MAFLIAAYAVIWAITFIFILSIGARQRRLARELDDVRDALGRQ